MTRTYDQKDLRNGSRREPGAPETMRVRMYVDLSGELGEHLDRVAKAQGRTREAIVREGLGYIHKALQSRRNGLFVGRP